MVRPIKPKPSRKVSVPAETISKNGQPPVILDEKVLYGMARTHLKDASIADIMGCSTTVLRERYADVMERGRSAQKLDLLDSMWYNALEKKNVAMQIWLSKQHLGYKESSPDLPTQVNFTIVTQDIPK